MTPNKPLTPDSACTCAEGKGCPLHATGMTPDREATLRPYHGSYLGKDEMWAEIDYLRQQLVAKDAEIERLTSTLEGCCESYRDQLASQQAYSERLEAECAEYKTLLDGIPQNIWERIAAVGEVEWGATKEQTNESHVSDFKDSLQNTTDTFRLPSLNELHGLYLLGTDTVLCHTGTSPNSSAHARILCGLWNWLLRNREFLSSTTLGTDLLARLQAAEKRRDELVEQNNTLLERFTGAIKALDESSALRSQLAEQERDMRQMVEALKYALPWAISGGASKERESAVIATRAALALPSAQRLMKKGD